MKNDIAPLVIGVIVGLLLFAFLTVKNLQKEKTEFRNLFETYESHLQMAETIKNKNKELVQAITSLETENDDLKSLVAELNARPEEIRFITRTETVLVPSEPTVITTVLPAEHLFTVKPNLTVAKFQTTDEGYRFDTYELKFRNLLVITDQKTSASLQVATSYDDTWQEVPVDVQVTKVREQKFFEPHVGLGVSGAIPTQEITASLWSSLFHPTKDIDLLGVRLSANTEIASIGIDPIGYNLGTHLPVLTDSWVWLGPSINTNGELAIDLTIGSKF